MATFRVSLRFCVCVCFLGWQTARLFDVEKNELLLRVQQKAPLLDCCFVSDEHLVTVGLECTARLYDFCLRCPSPLLLAAVVEVNGEKITLVAIGGTDPGMW